MLFSLINVTECVIFMLYTNIYLVVLEPYKNSHFKQGIKITYSYFLFLKIKLEWNKVKMLNFMLFWSNLKINYFIRTILSNLWQRVNQKDI